MTHSSRARVLAVVFVCLVAGMAGVFAQGRAGGPPQTVIVPQGTPPVPGQAPSVPVPTTGTAAISGVVVDGTTNQPVAGAVVSLSGGRITLAMTGPTAMITDNQGRFVFSRLPAGSYAISASKTGYTTGRYGQSEPSATTSARSIRLADGQWFSEAKTALWRPSAISGRVLDEAGEPVVGALVRVIAEVMVSGRPQLASATATKTDDRGVYRVSGLSAGKYVVMVPSVQASIPADATATAIGNSTQMGDPSFATVDRTTALAVGTYPTPASPAGPFAYPISFHPSARTIPEASAIDLRWGEERSNIDVRLSPVRSVRVTGVIQGPADAISGLVVRLIPVANEGLGVGAETATGLSTGNGAFTLLNVPPGNYILMASRSTMNFSLGDTAASTATIPQAPGYRSSSSGTGTISGSLRYSYANAAGSREYAARMPLVVGDQMLNDVVLTMNRTVTMTGRIVPAAPVPGAPDRPLPRLPIRVEPANGDPSLGIPTGQVAEDGTFRIEGLMPGPYAFRTLGIGGAIKSVEWEGRDYFDRPFDASTGRNIENVVVTLTNETARMTGNVRTAAGAPSGTGAVIAFSTDPARWSVYGFTSPRITSVQIGTTGAFTVQGFPAGEYFLIAVDDAQSGGWRDPKFLEAAAPLATRVTVGWGETKSSDLTIVTVKVR